MWGLDGAVLFLAAVALLARAQSQRGPDDTFLEVVRASAELTNVEIAAYKPYLFVPVGGSFTSPTRNDLADMVEERGDLQAMKRSLFEWRPNSWRLRVEAREREEFRTIAVSHSWACVSAPPEGEENGDWKNLPRPGMPLAPSSEEREDILGTPGIRVWPSAREVQGEGDVTIDWCFAEQGLSEQSLGLIKKTQLTSSNAEHADQRFVDMFDKAQRASSNFDQARVMEDGFDDLRTPRSELGRDWIEMDVMQNLFDGDGSDFGARDLILEPEWLNQTGFGNRVRGVTDRVREGTVSSLDKISDSVRTSYISEPPEAATDVDIVLSATAAFAGIIVEELLLQRVLGRPSLMFRDRKHNRPLIGLSIVIVLLATLDLLPLLTLVIQETRAKNWTGRSFVPTVVHGRVGGVHSNGTVMQPEGFGIGFGILYTETTHIHTNVPLIASLLGIAIVCHLVVVFVNPKRKSA
eukprot:CAMPEP_0198311110 /NCGR_PEP_ID=MMETSP1450-20131203/2939_1 /TAXON_ID=753684 ORGANISM="Madagascaria erythrocladiodes, Strain CCMP3234" /NCGR_SAMPLE_ID=MMETSP1450 /ASSEMBLY_ACC=CAM_ASM_001115 /LENGTH=464 /DNA_ID=CAMNT_0044013969 /DNA_START=81 /DNA_END=1475 /DNA_ORIENTATION=+